MKSRESDGRSNWDVERREKWRILSTQGVGVPRMRREGKQTTPGEMGDTDSPRMWSAGTGSGGKHMRIHDRSIGVWSALAGIVLGGATIAAPASAAPITFNGSGGNLAASATFDVTGTNLIITLSNTSSEDVLVPADVLTGVFFDSATALSLTRISAVVPGGSSVLFGGTDAGGVVGGEWAYRPLNIANEPNREYGISSSGLGLFGPGDRFPGNNLQGPTSPGGLEYGITSAGDNPATGNTPVTGTNALIDNSVVFTLSGLPVGFDPSTQISHVTWQYGTSLSEPHLPEPATLALVAVAGLLGTRRRR